MTFNHTLRRRRGVGRGGGYGGGSAPTSPLSLVGTPGGSTLYRSDVGFDTADWSVGQGSGATGTISAGGDGDFTFNHSDNGVSYTRYLNAVAARATQLIQAEFKAAMVFQGDYEGVALCGHHEDSADLPAVILNQVDTNGVGTTNHKLLELTTTWATGGINLAQVGHQLESNIWGFLSMGLDGASVDGYTDVVSANTHSGTATGPGTGRAGFYARSALGTSYPYPLYIRNYFVFTSQWITVTGLSGGRIAKLRDSGGSTLAQATEVTGTAVIDAVVCRAWDIADLAIYESDGTTLVGVSLTAPQPGETWTFSA